MAGDSLLIPKLADVALRAGVGNATVSRALNGGRNVSPDKMERVLSAVRELNYKPNRVAQSLKGASSGMVGMIVPSISDMFFSQCAEAVEQIVRENGALLVVLASHDENDTLLAGLRQLLQHQVEGLILASSQPHSRELVQALREVSVPVVGMDGPLTDAGLPSVLCANREGACAATEHLLSHGLRKVISIQVKPALYTMRERLLGYRSAMEAHGAKPVEEVITDRAGAVGVLRRHARGGAPFGVFAGNNLSARYVWEAVHALGLSIPAQVAVLCFDDFDLADSLNPPMSVVQQPLVELGATAARLLFEQMRRAALGTTMDGSRNPVLLSPRLVLRASCGCRPPATA